MRKRAPRRNLRLDLSLLSQYVTPTEPEWLVVPRLLSVKRG